MSRERLGSSIENNSLNKHSSEVIKSWQKIERSGENRFVKINDNELNRVIAENSLNSFELPSWHFPGVYPENPKAFVAQQLVANCFNYAFNIANQPDGKYTVEGEGRHLTGAFAMFSKINNAFGEGEVTTDDLERRFSSHNQTVDFFKGKQKDAGEEHLIPYPDLRFASVKDFVTGLKEKNQNPADLLKEVTVFDKSGEPVGLRAFDNGFEKGLVDLLIKRFPVAYGADIQHIDSNRFPFAKRAQLAALMLHGRAVESPDKDARLLPFVDIEKVGPVVDYQIPRTLKAMGVLEYTKDLAEKVDNWQEIQKDSREEIEIRAATAGACDSLLQGINNNRMKAGHEIINMAHLDYFLWVKSRTYKGTRPHLTETDAY